ncbi:uncharacterized protein HGUI_03560 [Hanseniaspora guilliermondii]|uniref:Exocyst complex component Sec10-like alpha-helical bundle domain-containing protein n=1 Tax=Hanseniaspora guilliermondii TaxID=56406 RepID=A0A1L0D2I2_9ASCO|nr:uncharacterized protein HGUI_03560 [Hanseniaspora guilliermondii]
MNNLFELDTKWKNIIDYNDTFLKDYEVGTDPSIDKTVIAFLNDMCNNLTKETFIKDSKIIDPKPYIRLLENCNKEIMKKLAENSLDNYKHNKESLNEREFEENIKPNFDMLKKNYVFLEQKMNKVLINNNNKGLLNLIQSLQLKLEKHNGYKQNVDLLKHYLYFFKLAQNIDTSDKDSLEDLYETSVSSIYKFEISELDKLEIERQSIINKEMCVVLEKLVTLSKKLEQKNPKLSKTTFLIDYIMKNFENSILEDFSLLHENLYNNVEHDTEVIYLGLNLIIDIYNKMNVDNNLIDVFVDKHPYLSTIKPDQFQMFSTSLITTNLNINLNDINNYNDEKFIDFLDNKILKIIQRESEIIQKIFENKEKLYVDTTSKLIHKILIDKVKPLTTKIINNAKNKLNAESYLIILYNLSKILRQRLGDLNERYMFTKDINSFMNTELLNFTTKQFQVDLHKTLNILFEKELKYITTQKLPSSSLNGVKELLRKYESKDFIQIINHINQINVEEQNNNKFQNLSQKTMTQFNSLLKHNDMDSSQGSLMNVSVSVSNFSLLGFLQKLKHVDTLQRELLMNEMDIISSKEQMATLINGMVEEYILRNFEIFYYIKKKDNKLLVSMQEFFELIELAQDQILQYYKIMDDSFNKSLKLTLVDKLENCINVLYIQYLLQFNEGVEKILKTQNRKDYLIDNRNMLVNDGTQSFNNLEKYMHDMLTQLTNVKSSSMNTFVDMLLQNLYKHLLKNYKKFDVNLAGGLVMNKDILNLYNCLESYSPEVVKVEVLNKFKLLKELVAIFTMRDLNNVRYLIDNSIYLKKSTEIRINEYIKKRV